MLHIQINRLDGSCPVQAMGTIEDHSAFYFRGRHEQWQFVAGPKELNTNDLVKIQLKLTQDDRVFVLEGDDEERMYLDYDHVRRCLQTYAQQYVEWMNEREKGNWAPLDGEVPDPNILADMLKETNKGKESKDWPWKSPYEDDDDIPQEPKYGSIDYIDHCMNNLGMSLNFADPDGTLSSKGYKNDNEKQIWQSVLLDYRTLSDAIAALRKVTNEQEYKEEQG